MSECVIVAIPEEYDPTYKVSSEKIPHMTLLYLGDVSDEKVIKEISDFVEHASSMAKPFGLSVDRRGKLGDDEADVLFFRNEFLKEAYQFRQNLLKNDTIRSAYDSADQYPSWTPHLTLGYPDAPAKKDDREYPVFHWVSFNKIAVWFGDFEGPEYPLREENNMGEESLAHYGVKGMKWGRRKASEASPTKSRKELRDLDRSAKKKDQTERKKTLDEVEAERRASIDAARARVSSGQNRREYKEAISRYKTEKKEIGRYQARKRLKVARERYFADIEKSQEIRDGKEATMRLLSEISGEIVRSQNQARYRAQYGTFR